ncbi:hypothetical protein SAMN04515656_11233 [Eubacterium aggregans]|uniref:Uncharacterized protein n=1 Tax=Eubacterium aggregans TaxID=81409 RepID=A0A1H4BQA6_9FIRM|nr:hypothetical protein SAMN04515656_11233 [Eubacterium aggregans]
MKHGNYSLDDIIHKLRDTRITQHQLNIIAAFLWHLLK